ncbi:hypothetical protein F4604DRAFT_1745022, partial [Suillus subluteus]
MPAYRKDYIRDMLRVHICDANCVSNLVVFKFLKSPWHDFSNQIVPESLCDSFHCGPRYRSSSRNSPTKSTLLGRCWISLDTLFSGDVLPGDPGTTTDGLVSKLQVSFTPTNYVCVSESEDPNKITFPLLDFIHAADSRGRSLLSSPFSDVTPILMLPRICHPRHC